VGAALAVVAAVILAFVPRLPSADTSNGHSLSSGGARITGSTSRRQRIFAVTQIAASFVLLAGASTVITTLIALQNRADEPRHAPRPHHQRSRYVLRKNASASGRFLQGIDSPH